MSIFGMGPGEIFVILVVALIVFGPDRLPDVARQVGKTVRDFRRMTSSLTSEFQAVTAELTDEFSELKAVTQELQAELREIQSEVAAAQHDVASELGEAQQALQVTSGTPASTQAAYGYNTADVATAGAYGATAVTQETEHSSTHQPRVASKLDPTADVSWLDMDELVVMARTSRKTDDYIHSNGHNGHEDDENLAPASRLVRSSRRAAIIYQRPRAARS